MTAEKTTINAFIREMSNNLLAYGLLYGDELIDYLCVASTIEGSVITINDYNAVAEAVLERVDKKLCTRHPDPIIKGVQGMNRARPVYQIDLATDKIIDRFESMAEAKRITGVNKDSIRKTCEGLQKKGGGYKWRYVD
jgi:hypothetical protein